MLQQICPEPSPRHGLDIDHRATGASGPVSKSPALQKSSPASAMIDHSDDDAASEPLLMFDDEQLHEITLSHLQP